MSTPGYPFNTADQPPADAVLAVVDADPGDKLLIGLASAWARRCRWCDS
jgi:hypothetical protein